MRSPKRKRKGQTVPGVIATKGKAKPMLMAYAVGEEVPCLVYVDEGVTLQEAWGLLCKTWQGVLPLSEYVVTCNGKTLKPQDRLQAGTLSTGVPQG